MPPLIGMTISMFLRGNGYSDIQNETSNSDYEVANVVNLRMNDSYYVAAPKDDPSRTSFMMVSYYKIFKRNMDFFRMFTREEWDKLNNIKEETESISEEEYCTQMSEMESMNFDEIKRGLSCLPIPSLKEMGEMTFSSFHESRSFIEKRINELKSSTAVKVYGNMIINRGSNFLQFYNSIKDDSVNMDKFLEEYGEENLLALLFAFHSIPDEQQQKIDPSLMFKVFAGLLFADDINNVFAQEMEVPYKDVIEKNYLENEHEYIPQLDMLTRILLAL